jgi:hypothetical protein
MYPVPPGPLPITGFNMIGFGLVGAVMIIAGVLALRMFYFSRNR